LYFLGFILKKIDLGSRRYDVWRRSEIGKTEFVHYLLNDINSLLPEDYKFTKESAELFHAKLGGSLRYTEDFIRIANSSRPLTLTRIFHIS